MGVDPATGIKTDAKAAASVMFPRHEQTFPAPTAEIARMRRFGEVRHYRHGEKLFETGRPGPGMFVILAGHELVFNTEVAGVEGAYDGSLERVRLRSRLSGEDSTMDIRNLFLFVGADPATKWLDGCGVMVDRGEFVVTGAQCKKSEAQLASALEISVPGVLDPVDAPDTAQRPGPAL